jgi:hypothetical protein
LGAWRVNGKSCSKLLQGEPKYLGIGVPGKSSASTSGTRLQHPFAQHPDAWCQTMPRSQPAEALTAKGIPTARGNAAWSALRVRRVLKRIDH